MRSTKSWPQGTKRCPLVARQWPRGMKRWPRGIKRWPPGHKKVPRGGRFDSQWYVHQRSVQILALIMLINIPNPKEAAIWNWCTKKTWDWECVSWLNGIKCTIIKFGFVMILLNVTMAFPNIIIFNNYFINNETNKLVFLSQHRRTKRCIARNYSHTCSKKLVINVLANIIKDFIVAFLTNKYYK